MDQKRSEKITDLSIIIITLDAFPLLRRCIESIRTSVRKISFEIIVVDNGSADGTADWLSGQKEIRTIRNEHNRGVAPARNQGLKEARGRYLLILDVDTEVERAALDTLVWQMESYPRTGIGAPMLTDADGSLQFTCRRYPTVFSKLYRRMPFAFAEKRLDKELLKDWDHGIAREVDYVIGACQIIRREAFDQVGLLDDKIFYGPEDIDYCLRMWKAGWKVMYFPAARVKHLEQRITRRLLSAITLKHALGLVYFFCKHRYLTNTRKLPGANRQPKAQSHSG
ncbi:MAG: glycosyltransferase family 2 protein [bacterium]